MKFDNFEINASPFFNDVYCPKHRNKMIELPNGWFSSCWYCKECDYPYTLEMRKMRYVDREALEALLSEKGIERQGEPMPKQGEALDE